MTSAQEQHRCDSTIPFVRCGYDPCSSSRLLLRPARLRAGVHAPTKSVSALQNVRSHGRRVRTCSAHQSSVFMEGVAGITPTCQWSLLITLSCRPRVLRGHKDYMTYEYHLYHHRHRHRFCRRVYARPKGCRLG